MPANANPFYKKNDEGFEEGVEDGPSLNWTVPAALLLIGGIVLANEGYGLLSALLSALVLAGVSLLKARWLLPLLLCIPLGYGRYVVWDAQPNPLIDYYGQTLLVTGKSDGQVLTLEEPNGVRVMLSPRGKVPPGKVTLKGDFFEAAGKRNPGGFDYASYLRRRGIWGQLYVDEVVTLEPARLSVKERLRLGVIAGLGEKSAALMQAMTLGIRDDLGELRDIFAASGLAHVLALSGLHVGILLVALNVIFRPLGLFRYPLLIALIIGFVLLVGATPSVVRASAMSVALLLSLQLGAGRIETWGALALSALFSLLWNPSWLFDISFQLSYLAVIGILLFTQPLMKLLTRERFKGAPWWHPVNLVIGSMVVSTAAQLLTLPLIVSSFGSLPLFSPFINVFAIPLATVLVPAGFLAGVAGLLSPVLSSGINLVAGLFAGALIYLAEVGSQLPHLIWGEVSGLGYLLFYIGIGALALAAQNYLKLWRALLVVLVASLCSAVAVPENNVPELIALDVGQGDSFLIRLPNRQEILIDAGGTPFSDFEVGRRTVLPALKALGIDELELVIASHTDADHMEGLIEVLREMPVNQLVIGKRKDGDNLFDRLSAVAEGRSIPITQVVRGQSLSLGNARLEILNPGRQTFDKDNDNSVMFVLHYDGIPRALFLGDASIQVEAQLAFPRVDIVVAGHHGSKSSTSAELLAAAQPEHVIFSYGRNTYGHPHPDVVNRVTAIDANVYETAKEGAVRLPLTEDASFKER